MSTESHTDRNGVTWSTYKEESLFSDYWTTRIPAVYRDPAPGFTKAATRAGLIDDIEAYAATHTVPAGDPTPSSPPPPPAMESTPPATSPAPAGSPPAPRAAVSSSLLRALERLGSPTATTPAGSAPAPGGTTASSAVKPAPSPIATPVALDKLSRSTASRWWWVAGGGALAALITGIAWRALRRPPPNV